MKYYVSYTARDLSTPGFPGVRLTKQFETQIQAGKFVVSLREEPLDSVVEFTDIVCGCCEQEVRDGVLR